MNRLIRSLIIFLISAMATEAAARDHAKAAVSFASYMNDNISSQPVVRPEQTAFRPKSVAPVAALERTPDATPEPPTVTPPAEADPTPTPQD